MFKILGVSFSSVFNEFLKNPTKRKPIERERKAPKREFVVYTANSSKCWWCHCPFGWQPLCCPLTKYYDPYGNRDIDSFDGEGFFCSLGCIKSYVLDQKGDPKYKDSLHLLGVLASLIQGHPVVTQNPHWKLLSDHGGNLDITAFRTEKIVYHPTINFLQRQYEQD